MVMLSPESTTPKIHGLQGCQADKDPNLSVADKGVRREEKPKMGLGNGGAKCRSNGVPNSEGYRALPEGMAPADRGQNRERGGRAGARPRPDPGARNSVDDETPQGFLQGVGAREGPGNTQGGTEQAQVVGPQPSRGGCG